MGRHGLLDDLESAHHNLTRKEVPMWTILGLAALGIFSFWLLGSGAPMIFLQDKKGGFSIRAVTLVQLFLTFLTIGCLSSAILLAVT